MRALIEGIGALFGMPVSERKDPRSWIMVRVGIATGCIVFILLAFAVR